MNFFAHLFLPRHTNNYRSKILHHDAVLFFIVILFAGSIILPQIKTKFPQVLGISTNMTLEQLLSNTNEKRHQSNLAPLVLNDALNTAAEKKAEDMFAKNYWAHISPTGTTPWFFIKESGYDYVYAGENLAKGFTTARDTVDAWMASPEHRANELSSNYQDVGFAVKTGKLNGEDTVLVVEEFGGKNIIPILNQSAISVLPSSVPVQVKAAVFTPIINSIVFSSNIYIVLISLFVIVLALDMIIVEKHKVVRIAGHNMDHILFLLTFLLAGLIIIKGVVI